MTPVVHGIGGATTIEPRTNYALVRLQQDLRDGQSGFGVIGTAVNRALDAWTTGALRSAAYVGGSDFRHRFADGTYELSGSVTASRVEGSPATIAELQRSAVHYYQRPDGALRFDSTRTSLSGDAEELLFGKISGITRFQTSYLRQSAGYEPNDLGFLLRADEQSWTTFAGLQYNTPHWFFRAAQVGVAQVNTWSTAGLRLENSVTAGGGVVLKNNWNMNAGATFSRLGKVYCDRCTRGGPAVRVSPGVSANLGVGGDDRQPVVPALSLGFGRSDAGRSSFAFIAPSAEVKLSTRLQTSIGVSVTHAIDDGQWYGNLTDAAGMTHYTFAPLDRETISVTARASFALTPNLTVEVYAQPFVTTGTYTPCGSSARRPAPPRTTTASRHTRWRPARPRGSRTGSSSRTRWCAGSTAPARRCSWCGSTAARTSLTDRTGGRGTRSSTTCSRSTPTTRSS